jgi:hypothetical protein
VTASDWGPDSPATVERDDADSVPSVAAPGRTPAREGDRTPGERTDDLRAEQDRIKDRRRRERELAAVMDPAAFDDMATIPTARRRERQLDALLFASSAISAGYRLVSDDEATVDRVAAAMFDAYNTWVTWGQADEGDRERFRGHARAAVRALRDGDAS